MRYFSLLFLAALPIAAQSNDTTQQALLNEVRELRLAIERSTLLGARTQLAVSQLQLDESAVARIQQQLNAVKTQEPGPARLARGAEQIKRLEQELNDPQNSGLPQKRADLQSALSQMKLDLEQAKAMEQDRATRESELLIQLQAAQNQAADARSRIADMEKALDAAIQQLLKPH